MKKIFYFFQRMIARINTDDLYFWILVLAICAGWILMVIHSAK